LRERRGSYRIVVGFLTTYAISASCEFESRSCGVYSIQHYVIKFVSDLWQVDGLLHVHVERGTKHPNPQSSEF